MCQLPTSSFNQTPLSPLPVPELIKQSQGDKKRKSRYKFWELENRYHCAALGTCLTLKELRQIGKKAGISGMKDWTDYDMHVSYIHALEEKSFVSVMVNKLLDKKYKLNILRLSKTKTEKDRVELWNDAVESGDVAGAFWALLTHPETTDNTLFQVYGKIHMLSHISGAAARIDMRDFHQLEQRNKALETLINKNELANNKKLEKKESQLNKLKTQLASLQTENINLKSAQQELDLIKKNPLVENLQNRVKQLGVDYTSAKENSVRAEHSEEKWKQRASREQEQKQQLEQQLSSLVDEKKSLENTLANLLGGQQDGIDNCATCPNSNPDLCGRCILYIGGRSGQYSHFRQLVEQQNGTFIHHDGGREDGHQKLASIVSKADVIFCPLDCVSHTAMNTVKRHCQNNTKQLVFIPHASLSAFSKGLDEVVN